MSTSLSGLSGNFFPSPQSGFTTTLASTISSGAATVPLNSVAGYTNGQIAVFVIEPTSSTAKQTFTGVIDTSGVQVTSVVWTAGTNQTHAGGVTVVDYATATHIGMMTKGITQQHTQAGAHTAITATSLATTGNISSSAGTVSTTLVDSLKDTSTALSTYRKESQTAFVASGLVITGDSVGVNKNYSMTAGVVYINGRRISINAVSAQTVGASKDRYVDILDNADGTGTIVNTEVTNNAASPALAANSMRIGIIVTGASNIAAASSINQGSTAATTPTVSSNVLTVCDSLGNPIYPTSSSGGLIGYRQITSSATQASGSAVAVTGLSCPVIIPTNRRVKITFFASRIDNSTATDYAQVTLWDGAVGGTQLSMTSMQAAASTPGQEVPASIIAFPLASGSKTYNIGLNVVTGGTAAIAAAATAPAFISVELV